MERVSRQEQLTVLSAAVALPNIPMQTTKVLLQAESQVVRIRMDGIDPTSSTGMRLIVGELYEFVNTPDIVRMKAIEETSGAKLNIVYMSNGPRFVFGTAAITHSQATAAGVGTVTPP